MASTISSSGSLSQSSDNGVGLSNPQLAQGRRTMLDLVNRLHSTGSVYLIVLVFIQLIFLARRSMQCASRYRSSSDCCYWFTECWKVLTHWIHIRNHSASCSWDPYTVLNLFFSRHISLPQISPLLVVLRSADSHILNIPGNVLYHSGLSPTHRDNY